METKWLVELRPAFGGYAKESSPRYYAGYYRDGQPVSTEDPWKAALFCDRYSATCTAVTLRAGAGCLWLATEHWFIPETHRTQRIN